MNNRIKLILWSLDYYYIWKNNIGRNLPSLRGYETFSLLIFHFFFPFPEFSCTFVNVTSIPFREKFCSLHVGDIYEQEITLQYMGLFC